ncbi:thiamine-phosphate kinase [Methylobacterium radiodurans]|uniref:Thiamine-monophosphate kinase n=1 Tax=Methylobacterium radiodurans TaxID=2202828 RepID=A0A2U8VYW6_9HYPH|nr:thiamine-phosphate kinase [Methylobacterium radiodurans]AWN38442.1 thiamine-phosphate kinase [Methylobacterium radiodurans]
MSGDGPRLSEEGLIARHFAPLAGPGADGLRDDAASLSPTPGHDLVVTVDAVVAGVHYFPDDPPASVAAKALGVNLSDLAAKGAAPRGFLLTLALAPDWTEDWLAAFARGLGEAAALHGCPLLGGDTVRAAGPTLISVTAFGEVPAGGIVRRGTARAGDLICVSGTIGDAAIGLRLRLESKTAWARALRPEDRAHLADRYLHPRPRLALASAIRRFATAAMDVSDGLAGDLAKMLPGLMGRIETAAVPLSAAACAAIRLEPALMEPALTGGDDYEILCTVAPDDLDAFRAQAAAAGVPVTSIGTVAAGEGAPVFRGPDGAERRFPRGSFSHF